MSDVCFHVFAVWGVEPNCVAFSVACGVCVSVFRFKGKLSREVALLKGFVISWCGVFEDVFIGGERVDSVVD